MLSFWRSNAYANMCVCDDCRLERHGLVGLLRMIAKEQEEDWVDTHYDAWLLVKAADRIEELENAEYLGET